MSQIVNLRQMQVGQQGKIAAVEALGEMNRRIRDMSDGTDLAREVANVLLTQPSLNGLVDARLLGARTLQRIHSNFVATMTLNSLFLLGGLFMILGPGVSALLHNLTTMGVSLNAMRPHLPPAVSEEIPS